MNLKQSLNHRLKLKFVRKLITRKRLKRKMRKIKIKKFFIKIVSHIISFTLDWCCGTHRGTNLTSFNIRWIIKLPVQLTAWWLPFTHVCDRLNWPAMQVNFYGHNICLLFVSIIFIYLFIYLFIIQPSPREREIWIL